MLIIWGYLLLIVLAGVILIFCGAFLLRLLYLGIYLFFVVGIVTLVLAFFGVIEYSTSWTITKWAFIIGGLIGIVQFLRSPLRFLSDTANIAKDIGDSISSNSENTSVEEEHGDYSFPCCDNCKWNYDRGSYTVRCFQDGSRNKVSNEKCGQWQHY